MPFEAMQHVAGNRMRMPGPVTPLGTNFKVLLVYKNLWCDPTSSFVGLSVISLKTMQYLRSKGIYTDVSGVDSVDDIHRKLNSGNHGYTHVIIFAPWLHAHVLTHLAFAHPAIEFAVTCHSNVGFLSADAAAFEHIREYMKVELNTPNFHLACNSEELSQWVRRTYGTIAWDLPNLYMLDGTSASRLSRPFSGDLLRIGCFGAVRILKNTLSAGAAALEIAKILNVDVEFFISSHGIEGENKSVIDSLREMFAGVRFAKLIDVPWENWAQFKISTVAHMDLGIQPSYTETFNLVAADFVSEGKPSVVGHAIKWAPDEWKANVDEVSDIARVGINLLYNPTEPERGLRALTRHNEYAFSCWRTYLEDTSPHI